MRNLRIQKKMIVAFSTIEFTVLAFFLYAIFSQPSAVRTGVLVAGIFLVYAIGVAFTVVLSRGMRFSLANLLDAVRKISQGDVMDIHVEADSSDEIGELGAEIAHMAETIRGQAQVIQRLADGDFTVTIQPNSQRDVINQALLQLVDKNSRTLSSIRAASGQVAAASEQIAQSAQNLASGSAQQAATLERFGDLLEVVQQGANTNAEYAVDSRSKSMEAGGLMMASIQSMETLTTSMKAIEEGSQSITKVIKVIDDIAFQTNILALNAAVEAARAGVHGKGFAVVADEVRNLASKSAEAASETASLIENSTGQVQQGRELTEQTLDKIMQVATLAQQSTAVVEQIVELSEKQKESIAEINKGVHEVAAVTHANAATAEQSAASSEEMSSQSYILRDTVGSFRLRGDADGAPRASAAVTARIGGQSGEAQQSQGFALSASEDKYA